MGFREYTNQKRKEETLVELAVQLKRHNVSLEGFVEWFLDQDDDNVVEGWQDMMNVAKAGWQGAKNTAASWGKTGASVGAGLGGAGGLAAGGVGAIPGAMAGAGIGGVGGAMAGGVAGGLSNAMAQWNNPQHLNQMQVNQYKSQISGALQGLQQLWGQDPKTNQKKMGNLQQIVKWLQSIK